MQWWKNDSISLNLWFLNNITFSYHHLISVWPILSFSMFRFRSTTPYAQETRILCISKLVPKYNYTINSVYNCIENEIIANFIILKIYIQGDQKKLQQINSPIILLKQQIYKKQQSITLIWTLSNIMLRSFRSGHLWSKYRVPDVS